MINRLLIVGHGSIGKRHLRIARDSLPEAEICVLRHQPCAKTPEFADGCFGDLAEACSFEPQAAVIANPAPFHLDLALALADVGCHLLVEKPLAHKVNKIDALLKNVRKRNLVLQVGYNLRFLPCLEEFRQHIHAGATGKVLSVRCEFGQYLPSWRPDADYRLGVSAQYELGGGVLLEQSHELDYLRWIFGEVEWVNAWLGRQSNLEIDVEDTVHLTLGFKPDVSGRSLVAALSVDFIRHDTKRLCTVIGETSSMRWNGLTGEVEELAISSGEWRQVFHYSHQRDDSYRAQLKHFLNCIKNGVSPKVTGEDGLAVLRIVEASRVSNSLKGTRIFLSSNSVHQDK